MDERYKKPGVYINEVNAFPNSVVPVPTAIPAFIGYTPQALYNGKPCFNIPKKISTFAEFQAIYCFPNPAPPAIPSKLYNPQYYLVKQTQKPQKGGFVQIGSDYYSIVPDPNTVYYLYNSIRLFYQNGGGDAYIVSVGPYGKPSGKPGKPGGNVVNQNVKLNTLLKGLEQLKKESEPTMYICPEATLLSVENNGTLMQEMLLQCSEMQTAISIFDIIGAKDPDPNSYTKDIQTFRNNTGNTGLSYGVAYYPFIGTTIMQDGDLDYTNLFGGDIKELKGLLIDPVKPDEKVVTVLKDIENPPDPPLTVRQYHNSLRIVSPIYKSIMEQVLKDTNLLPPSGAMAGVMTMVDNSRGVWKAPANVSIAGVAHLPIQINSQQQEDLNVDAVSGKSINAIRSFTGQGILVWGARTLDGNSQDWRYVPVRRTMIFIEQSCKLAAQAYVFEPNDQNTWTTLKSMISNFLTNIWKAGGLAGAKPEDAFFVQCGLGSTMTAQDILEGYMRVTIGVAVVHPAEFILISFQLQMATS